MSEKNLDQDTKSSLLEQLEALEIPPDIDPRLLELWLYREREEIDKQGNFFVKTEKKPRRKLTWLFAAYIGILVMCLAIVLGMLQGKDTSTILQFTCQVFLVYTIIGFFIGWIAEYCVTDSVETLLREIIRRSDESAAARQGQSAEPASEQSQP